MRSATRPSPDRPPGLRLVPRGPVEQPRELMSPATLWYAFAGAMLLAIAVRAGYILLGDFSLNDGGLFFAMTRDLQASSYRLPDVTSYNDAGIPFAYPPLALYLAAALDDLTPMGLPAIFRAVPLAANLALVPAFFLLARRLLPSRLSVACAVIVFAMLPRAFYWMIMGGGITRSLGFTFALFAIWAIVAAYQDRRWRYALLAGLLGGLALLSHIQMAYFVAFSAVCCFAAFGRHSFGLRASVVAALIAAGVASPWWVAVLAMHGPDPFLAAARASNTQTQLFVSLLQFKFTSEPLFPVITVLGVGGTVLALARRQYLLPAWIAVALFLDQRAFGTVATVPLALLAGIAAERLILFLLPSWTADASTGSQPPPRAVPPWLGPVVCTVAVAYIFLSASVAGGQLLTPMSRGERDAMAWVANNTPPDSRIVVVTGDYWFADRTSEWFPYLAQRDSVATTQGYEWLTGGVFANRVDAYRDLQKCADEDAACIEAWAATNGQPFDYIYVPKLSPRYLMSAPEEDVCCAAAVQSLRNDTRYGIAYDGEGAVIFQRAR